MVALTAAGAIGAVSQAEAARYYWWDSNPGYYRAGPIDPQRRPRIRRHQAKKIETREIESGKPQGPLIIAISIEQQRLKIFDANGFFAETPVSTGMKGHPTPMGVFSVIQKHKLHHSNIYSGAPMPYMQRITWSGVAMHAGVLPGYPASHGCIRMPMAFAVKMWNWTKMGARVVITPGEMTPASFSHPLLVAQKVVPQPATEPQADAPPAAKSDRASDAGSAIKPPSSGSLELKSSVGHDDLLRSAADETPALKPLRHQTRTADASGDMPVINSPVTMTDASPSGSASRIFGEAKATDPTSEPANLEAEPNAVKPGEAASSETPALESKPSGAAAADIRSAETGALGDVGSKPNEAAAASFASGDDARTEVPTAGIMKAEKNADEKKIEAKDVSADPPKPEAPKSAETSEKPNGAAEAVTNVDPNIPGAGENARKDQTRLPDTAKPAASKTDTATPATPKRSGQIAAFVSRKDSRLYVRQEFKPLFDVPVMIAPSDRPLGTHVFTARIDKDDANVVHWSVISLPVPVRYATGNDRGGRFSHRRKSAAAPAEAKPLPVPDSPAEALDRLTIPADAMARITDALSTGSSIIVSDQGIAAGETGEGTDFIVSLR